MEKLFDYKKGKIHDEHTKLYRFQCDCLSPEDSMDISVESWGKDDEGKYYEIMMNFEGSNNWSRFKYAWQILRGRWTWRYFCVRDDDLKNLSDIFDPNKSYSELP